ncbi:hypothetical protein COCNU_04G009470 [Cocos nucifera]|uniref:Potassium transporter n=1 Tax=Cocos nucifera TaxID=13894 RepID=A0A8K0I6B0_COCNU|nr:hypothetical protein COCNU_04G009470 [Cocos nucifera]
MGDTEVEERSIERLAPSDAAQDGSPPAFSSGKQLRRNDSLDLEAGSVSAARSRHFSKGRDRDWGTVMRLAFQSVGIVYGDIGTSPLYVYASTFTEGIRHEDDILGVLSLILYTITLITLVKYVFIVLRANDNGDVLSAVGGIKEATDAMTEDRIVLISVIILILLFLVQRFGTDKVGYSFAPIITIWFLFIAGIGVYNFVKYDPWVVKAINPKYIINYFQRNGKTAWISLGGVVLCITGIAVVFVMTLTSALLTLIMIMIWKTHIIFIILYVIVIGSVELVYLSSVLYKFDQGGYLPLAFAAFLIITMLVWNYVYRKRYMYELSHKVPSEKVEEIVLNSSVQRIPGIAFFYSELVQGIPPIFEHYVANVPALHSVLVFVSIKSLPISRVPADERFLFCRVGSYDCHVFRCVARYGYKDARSEHEPFDAILVQRLKEFIEESWRAKMLGNDSDEGEGRVVDGGEKRKREEVLVGRELELVEREWKTGVVHLLGENEVVAAREAGMWKRFLIDYAYGILKRNIRQQNEVFTIPRRRLLKVGMTIEL